MSSSSLRRSVRDFGPSASVGLFAFLLAVSTIDVPSIWVDETATRIAVELDGDRFSDMLREIDLVHGAYYSVLRAWATVAGTSIAALRLPSAVAIGLTASMVVVLGRRVRSTRVGVLGGIVLTLLPPVLYTGGDARPRALACAAVTAACLAFVIATQESGGRARLAWTAHAALGSLAVVLNVHDVLVIAALGVTVLVSAARRSVGRSTLVGWTTATAASAAIVVPFMCAAAGQVHQVGWIERPEPVRLIAEVGVFQWFFTSIPAAIVGWGCVLVALTSPRRRGPGSVGARTLLVPWLLLPTAVLVATLLTAHPMYHWRYPSMSLPALALLIALGLDRLRPLVRWAVAAVLVVACVVSWTTERFDAPRPDLRRAAQVIVAERSVRPGPAGIVYGPSVNRSEDIRHDRPEAVRGLRDLTLLPARQHGAGWFKDQRAQPDVIPRRSDGLRTVFYVGMAGSEEEAEVRAALDESGFDEVSTRTFRGGRVGTGVVTTFVR
ncbi:glycosyltransferase family 39 protein [Curtobacterium sp. BRD11]|uniref:glycosyltransferase family 39 protein n=1 Tax=Curtobacterium sp. BRD11 TaxID=2962581 RepID=UPI002881505F|nr:glycosyltransferase family 39 protein [Curtobacterium sp. BRD11]MDT0210774.1 glycosyltransferase family 39 protein [Curtobacterium sp. BRD11]